MSNLPGNPFATTAEEQESVAHALLALAYEQRTANMIAYYTDEDLVRQADSKKLREMTADIRKRIGVAKPQDD